MKVLVACEFSGIVRDAFAARWHDAWSCDLLPSERPGNHIQGDVLGILGDGWDLMIAHPPCTYLALSGMRWYSKPWSTDEQIADRIEKRDAALEFCKALLDAPITKIALEQPMSLLSSKVRKYDQRIQPWQFGHGEQKTTWLWLKNLPPLKATDVVEGRDERVHREPPGPNRWKNRSRTYQGIANAMAAQWG